MLDQNTDRMWYVIGAVLVGAAIILIANGTLPEMFANVTDSMYGTLLSVKFDKNLINDPKLQLMSKYYWLEPGEIGRIRPIATKWSDPSYGRVTNIKSHFENQGVFYRDQSWHKDDELLEEGVSYRMEVMLRSDTNSEVGIALDGGRLSRADKYTLSDEWQLITLERVSNGENTRPRVYTTSAGSFDIAYMNVFEVIEE